MKSIGKCLSEKYVLNGIIESRFSDAYAYIFDYMFNFILYNLSLLTLGFLFHHPIAVTIYIICWILILVVSPVDTPNKVFSKSAKKTARKKTYIIFFFNSIFTILSLLLHWNRDLIFIDLSLIICATGLYIGYISNIRRHHES